MMKQKGIFVMQLQFLGTGAGIPSKLRNVTSILLDLLQETNQMWMFDCGEATQHQILSTSIRPRKIAKIFITHLHGDHIYGLPGFLSSRSFQGGDTPVQIFGPEGLKDFIQTSLKVGETKLNYPLEFIDTREGVIYEDSHFIVEAKLLQHGVDSYGYIVQQKDLPGSLLPEKLRAEGIQPGPIFQQIKENDEVILDNGKKIISSHFKGPKKKGKKVAILGDTKMDYSVISKLMGANVLVHEATFSEENQDLASAYYHSTTRDAATIAKEANVKKLILTHISSRYQPDDAENLLAEAKDIFQNCYIANDFDVFSIE